MNTLTIDTAINQFEKLYLQLREKEKRIYTDEEVIALPEIAEGHPHYAEWQMRKQSAKRLVTYLQREQRPLKILEVGCGNGVIGASN